MFNRYNKIIFRGEYKLGRSKKVWKVTFDDEMDEKIYVIATDICSIVYSYNEIEEKGYDLEDAEKIEFDNFVDSFTKDDYKDIIDLEAED